MEKEINTLKKIKEEDLVDFFNSHYFSQQENKSPNDIITLPKCENDLKKIVFDVEHAISQKSLSDAYNLSKYLLNKIAETMISNKETMKVVINDGYGGFFLSEKAIKMLAELKGKNPSEINIYDSSLKRHDEDLVKVVEALGDGASGICAELIVVEIPNGIEYTISDYDGWEKIIY